MELLKLRNSKCVDCELHKGVHTVCLFGRGSSDAEVVFVGEAPGLEEDNIGKPFVGRSGKLLDNILNQYKYNREKIYITNAVKCRPPNNRRPKTVEFEACRKYLLAEMKYIKPKLVVALGQLSMMALMGTTKVTVSGSRGKVNYSPYPELSNVPIICTYHPAAVIRDSRLIESVLTDFEFIKEVKKHGVPVRKKCKYKLGVAKVKEKGHVTIDVETTGLNPFSDSARILCIGSSTRDYTGYVTDNVDKLRDILSDISVEKVGHNIKFDIKYLRKMGFEIKGLIYDTMVAEHLINENQPSYGLKELSAIYTDMGAYSARIERYIDLVGSMSKVPKPMLHRYCAQDVDAANRLRTMQLPILKEEGLIPLLRLVMAGERVMIDAELAGVKIDKKKLEEIREVYTKKIKVLSKQIRDIAGIEDLNVRSGTQMGELLTGKMGLPIIKVTKGGKVSVDKLVLEELEQYDRSGIVKRLIKYRKYRGDYGKYLSPTKRIYEKDGCVHATFNIHGTDTGRYSCVRPNLQQVPRDSPIKSIFRSRFKDGKIIQIDYNQGELRILAQESRDKKLIEAFNSDKDIHKVTASSAFGIEYDEITDEQRYNAKVINFGIIYGMGIKKLARQTKMSIPSAARFLKEYKQQFPGVRQYIRDRSNEVLERGYVENLFKRRRRIIILNPDDKKELAAAQRKAVNSPIQGGLHDLNVLSMTDLWYAIKNMTYKSIIILAVHDSVIIDAHPNEVDDLVSLAKTIFENPNTERFGFKFVIPVTVSIGVGRNWKEASDNGK